MESKDINRFWSKVNVPDDWEEHPEKCWEWMASCNPDGYGHFGLNGWMQKSHRISYELYNGPIPEGMLVCHTCDNPGCVNPNHLFLGTNMDNKKDSISKDRHSFGERISKAKLTDKLVIEIIEKIKNGEFTSAYQVEQYYSDYGFSFQMIYAILHRKYWKHITKNLSDDQLKEIRDKLIKDTSIRAAKLTIEQVKEIKQRLQDGEMGSSIAKIYGIHDTVIYKIKNGKLWSHIKI